MRYNIAMRSFFIALVPCIFIAALVYGAMKLQLFLPAGTCALGGCPLTLHESDSGKTFRYSVTTRFTLLLDAAKNPQAHLQCLPEGIIGSISNAPAVAPPLYAARYEAVAAGTCILTNDNFSAKIVVE